MDKQQAQEQLKKLQAEMDSLKAIIEKPEKWSPEGGGWFITADGVYLTGWTAGIRDFGMERTKRALALRARDEMRRFNRVLAYVHQYAPEWVADWSDWEQDKYFVYYNHDGNRWCVSSGWLNQNIEPVMPKHVAKQLCDDLNSGRVEL